MRISNKGLYALEAMVRLARSYPKRSMRIHEIAEADGIPQKFLELILLDLKMARLVESIRGAKGGYRLKRPPEAIFLGEIIRGIDGPLSPFADAETLRSLVNRRDQHSGLYQVLLDVRNAVAGIIDHTSLADLVFRRRPERRRPEASPPRAQPRRDGSSSSALRRRRGR
jgi:Rrf2 family protein